jgi:predicted RNA-binding Zn-ribbon protein involved in translation (DUF1610 family)
MLMEPMDAFSPNPPDWTNEAIHAHTFACPQCGASEKEAKEVWLNRYAPVQMENRRRKWQEFYHCNCGKIWWGWSSDRPPNEFADRKPTNDPDLDNFFGYF